MKKDRNDELMLPKYKDLLKELRDDQFEEYIANNNIHRSCHWDVYYDEDGKQHAKIVCDFGGQKKKTFHVR